MAPSERQRRAGDPSPRSGQPPISLLPLRLALTWDSHPRETGGKESKGTQKDKRGRGQKGSRPAHQIGIGPVALQGSGHFANDQVIHLLGGFGIVSEEAKAWGSCYPPLAVPPSHLRSSEKRQSMPRATWSPRGPTTRQAPRGDPGLLQSAHHGRPPALQRSLRGAQHQHRDLLHIAEPPGSKPRGP